MSWLKKLKSGLSKTSTTITTAVTDIVKKRKLDDDALEMLEDALIQADLGVKLAIDFTNHLAKTRFDAEITDDELKDALADHVAPILEGVAAPLPTLDGAPTVILMVGVNGNGKTTTAGKLAAHYKAQGHTPMLVACDTFRAAAVEQLQVWGQRVGCVCHTAEAEADPASVAYAGLERARKEGADVVLIDTAGRLQTKHGLMEELGKIKRVLGKLDDTAPHHTILVLDATTGQNAHSQVEAFKSAADISGLILTKLDGTARGGVLVALADKFGLPVHAIGVGEAVDDLQPFDPREFARSMVGL